MNEVVYKLVPDVERLGCTERECDLFHHPFKDQDRAIYIWSGSVDGDIPDPLVAYADLSELVARYDYPVFSLGLPVISKKMLDTLLGIRFFEYKTIPLAIFEEKEKDLSHLGVQPRNLNDANSDYYVFNVIKSYDLFDFDQSEFKPMRSDPSRPNVIKKLVLKRLNEGFPPIFRVKDVTGIFISDVAKLTLEQAGINGLYMEKVAVS